MKSRILGLLAFALIGVSGAALSDPITYDFTVTATSGPLTGDAARGSFTFDSSIIPAGGGRVQTPGVFTDLLFKWNGITYTAATANTGELFFNSAGTLFLPVFGTDCGHGFCAGPQTPFTNAWFISNDTFEYSMGSSSMTLLSGTVSYSPAIPPTPRNVPEPATLSLLALGLVSAGLMSRRKKKLTAA